MAMWGDLSLCILVLCSTCSVECVKGATKLNPVVLVPGDGGSQIVAKLNKSEAAHYFCSKVTSGYFSLWLDLELLTPFVLDCFVDNMRLVYDTDKRITRNNDGVDIKIPNFGATTGVEWLDPSHMYGTSYFGPIADGLVTVGYKRGVSIRGAPYDFRKAPNEQQEFLVSFKKLIEDSYYQNKNMRVVLVAHSMGNPYSLYFLNKMTQAWKDKFIKSFITLGGPWGGAAKIMRLFTSGDNLGVYVLNYLTIRPMQRSFPSSAWLMPSDDFWGPDEVLVYGPKRNYTVKDYKQFFADLDFNDGYAMRQDTYSLTKKLTPPGVEVYCTHGVNVSTPAVFKYSESEWPNEWPTTINSDGDGTVNIRSLLGCLRWSGKQKQPVHHHPVNKADHMGILSSKDAIELVKQVALKKDLRGRH